MGSLDVVRNIKLPGLDPARFRADDCEVYTVAGHWQNISEHVCCCMDLMQSACRTKYFFSIHPDCFPRRRDLLEWMMAQCDEVFPVVGHAMTVRRDPESRLCAGHTATMFHMPTIHKIGLTWSMRRSLYVGKPVNMDLGYGWPDTETTFNRCLRAAGYFYRRIGKERNRTRTRDEYIDHVRSGTLDPVGRAKSRRLAIAEAWERVKAWKGETK
jgi:hypothetical protein